MTDNPNAFPADETANQNDTMGMTLRDYFAGQALVGIITSGPHDCTAREEALDAYAYADFMLEARK